MENVEKVAFLVRKPADVRECVRSAVGLGVDNFEVGVFIVDCVVKASDHEDEFLERLEMIDDLDGTIWSDVRANTEQYKFIEYMPVETMAARLRTYNLIVTF